MRVAILGSGNIGTDLLVKILRSPWLECALFIGRTADSPGMRKAKSLGVRTSDRRIEALLREPDCCDLVFDATSAMAHQRHWPILERLGKFVIDLTPSNVGRAFVPAVDIEPEPDERNVNMVSCGGQTSLPLAYLIGQVHRQVDYVEVVSSIASRSAGPATRINIDEYIETTEEALRGYSGSRRAKKILILNPARPCVRMKTTLSAKVERPDLETLAARLEEMERRIRSYVPGYEVVVPPTWEKDRIMMSVRVTGLGDYLPAYAGNLDIINCAAIATAESYARRETDLAAVAASA